jgi:hypothetical protein
LNLDQRDESIDENNLSKQANEMLSINKRTVNRSNIITVENKDVYLQETIG